MQVTLTTLVVTGVISVIVGLAVGFWIGAIWGSTPLREEDEMNEEEL